MDRSEQLRDGKILTLLLKFSVPAIVGMLVNALYNVVDRIFIGQGVGPLAIAGINVSFPLMIVGMAFGMLIGIGSTALISIKLGEEKKHEAEVILAHAFILLVVVSGVLSVLGLVFLDPLSRLFGASQEVLPYSRAYLSIILYGFIFQSIGFGLNNTIRAEGNPKTAMFTMLIGAILNTILDPIFIFVFKMGIQGAALATILSQAVSAVWVLYYFFKGKSLLKIRRENMRLRWTVVGSIVAIGMAPFSMQLVQSVIIIIFNNALSTHGGDIAIAGFGIVNSIAMLFFMPVFGINQGAQPIIGFNYGAKQYDRVKKTLKLAILAATALTTLGFIVTHVIPEQLVMIFNSDPELVAFGAKAMQIFLLLMPIIGFQVISSNYFQAVGKPKHAMLLTLSRQVFFLIPTLLILPRIFGLNGVLYAGPVSDFASSVVTGLWLLREVRQLDRRQREVAVIK